MKKGTKVLNGYFADDGKFFEDEKKCRNYEMQKVFDGFKDKCRYDGDWGGMPRASSPGKVEYFAPESKEDIANFIMVMNYFGYTTNGILVNSPISIYKFDNDKKEYINLIQEYNAFVRTLNTFLTDKIPEYHMS